MEPKAPFGAERTRLRSTNSEKGPDDAIPFLGNPP